MSVDITVVIPHRGPTLGLWSTVHSCADDLLSSPEISHNFVIVTNGDPLSKEDKKSIDLFEKSGLLLKHIHQDEPLSPPAARQRGAATADGRILCFFDNHCVVGRDYFKRVIYDFERRPMDVLHSTTQYSLGWPRDYHYKLRLGYNFWAESVHLPPDSVRPYKIAAAGHGGFAVLRKVWEEVGGYGPDSLFSGYGGEELSFDLRMWLLGKSVWIDPKLVHYHYMGARPYSRHFTDEYYTNLLASAHIVGGEKWLYKVFDSFINGGHVRVKPRKHMYALLLSAYERTAEYAADLASKRSMDLDELLVWFRLNQVAGV